MKKNTVGVSTLSLDGDTSSVNDHDEAEPNTPEDFKVILKTVFEDFGARIDSNAQSIAKITDLMSGLSTQMTKLMSERNMGSSSIIQGDNNHGSSTNPGSSLVDLIGSPHQYASRLTKIEFPRFGGDDVRGWLLKVEQFFSLDRIREDTKLPLAILHLEGKALQWHQGYMQNRNQVVPNWKQYVSDISSRFGAPYDDPMAELMELKQTGTVTEVHEQFDSILSRLQLPPQYALSCFMTALNEDISNMVRMFKPSTIQEAFSLAKIHESTLQKQKNKQTTKTSLLPTPKHFPNTYNNNLPFTTNTSKLLTYPNRSSLPNQKPNTTRKTLTPTEMDEKRAKGLCFFCDEKYTIGHICRGKKPQLYHLEVDDIEEEPEVAVEEFETDNENNTEFAH